MNYDYKQTNFSKALLGGLFTGLITCIASEIYNAVFRYFTGFEPSNMINVEILIFEPILFCIIAGIIYFVFTKFMKTGRLLYTILFLLITVGLIYLGFQIHLNQSDVIISQFRALHTGIIVIIGGSATFLLPYLTKHDVLIDK